MDIVENDPSTEVVVDLDRMSTRRGREVVSDHAVTGDPRGIPRRLVGRHGIAARQVRRSRAGCFAAALLAVVVRDPDSLQRLPDPVHDSSLRPRRRSADRVSLRAALAAADGRVAVGTAPVSRPARQPGCRPDVHDAHLHRLRRAATASSSRRIRTAACSRCGLPACISRGWCSATSSP